MADLESLIKYRKHIVDEKQRVLSQLYREAEQIEQRKRDILAQIEKEKAFAAKESGSAVATALAAYLDSARKDIARLDVMLQKMEKRIADAQEDMRAAFAEQKKIEIVQRERLAEEEAEVKKKEGEAFDEIAIEGFRRRQEEEETS